MAVDTGRATVPGRGLEPQLRRRALAILAIHDAAYVRHALLADASPAHAGTAMASVVMTGLVMIGLVVRPRGRVLRVGSWVSIGMAATLVFIQGG